MNDIQSKTIFNYSLGNLSFGIVLQMISSFLTFYGTSVLGISGTIMGTMVSISIIWDAITDPIMGYVSDNTRSKLFGKRHGYILVGLIMLTISNIMLWSSRPEYSMGVKIGLVFVSLMLCETFCTVFATPYSALGAELSDDYAERTKIQATKAIFFLIGLAMPTVLGVFIFFRPTPAYPLGQLNPDAYLPLGIATSAVAVISGVPCIVSTWKYRTISEKRKEKFSVKVMLKDMLSPMVLKDSRCVILGYLWQNVSTAIVMALNLHIFTYTFRLDSTSISLIMAVLLLGSMVSQPYWVKRTMKKEKKHAMIEALTIALVGSAVFTVMVVLRSAVYGKGWLFIPFGLIVGFAMGGMVSIPQTMLIDTIDVDEYLTGKRKEGSIFGCMTFFYKLSQATTMFVLGIFLDVIGFDSSIGMQTPQVDALLGFSLPVGLFVSLGITIICFAGYTLTRDKVIDIQKKLAENKGK